MVTWLTFLLNVFRTGLMAGSRDHTIFTQGDLFERGFPVMEEIRRKGKLCDVTLKVSTYLGAKSGSWFDGLCIRMTHLC